VPGGVPPRGMLRTGSGPDGSSHKQRTEWRGVPLLAPRRGILPLVREPGIMAKHKAPATPPEPSPPEPTAGYTVLARRYRPQTFAELIGQEPVARALTNALKGNRVAHAYLFTGARGVGKTSAARILAKALNCINGPTPEPCGVCDICTRIATGEDVDVLEIDGASNNGVDNIRDLRGNTQYMPQRARFKIYVIDEVHMLSKGAFNALLKTLEEPPPHVKFIFATTEVDKVPITILSRCQRFDFTGISIPQVVARLTEIVEREKLKADPEALELVARRSGGSMRDAQSLLDQLLAFGGDHLTVDQVHHLLGTAGDDRVIALANGILNRDSAGVLSLLEEAASTGLQLGELVDQLIAYWRDLMIVSCGGTEGHDLSVQVRHHETLRAHAKSVTLDTILAGLDVLSAARSRMQRSNHARTLVEMALVRMSRLHDLMSLSQLAGMLRGMPAPTPGSAPTLGRATTLPEGVKKKGTPGTEPAAAPLPTVLTEATLETLWPQILSGIAPLLAGELRKAGLPAISGPNTLVLRFPLAYNKSCDYLQQPDRLAVLEESVRKLTGKAWTIQLQAPTAPANSTGSGEPTGGEVGRDKNGSAGAADAHGRARKSPKEEVTERFPLVRRAVDVFGATIRDVAPEFGSASEPAEPSAGGRPEEWESLDEPE
jgi:DNA polymerase III subunit gamma/tau